LKWLELHAEWLLSEGRYTSDLEDTLPHGLVINLKERAFRLSNFGERKQILNMSMRHINPLGVIINTFIYSLSITKIIESELDALGIMHTFSNIMRRSTTKPEDEPTCLASIFGLDVAKILDLPKEQRQQAVFSSLAHVPASLVFFFGPRIQAQGCRWIPESLLEDVGRGTVLEEMGVVSLQGLIIELPGFILAESIAWYRDTRYYLQLPGDDIFWEAQLGQHIDESVPRQRDPRETAPKCFQAVISQAGWPWRAGEVLLLGVIWAQESGVLYVRSERILSVMPRKEIPTGSMPKVIEFEQLPHSQIWCVG
jgi:hypothetical protein